MTKPAHPTEEQFAEVVIGLAKLRGWRVAHFRPALVKVKGEWTYRTPMQGDTGFPDLVMARNGVILFVELKSATGTLSTEQRAWRDVLAPTGHWQLWRPDDLDTIKETLR